MKITEHQHSIQVRVIDSIALNAREADFLRKMAKHCIATRMQGSAACEDLIKILDVACVPVRDDHEPVYGIFTDPEDTSARIKP